MGACDRDLRCWAWSLDETLGTNVFCHSQEINSRHKVFEEDTGERETRPPRVGGPFVTLTRLPPEPAECTPSARPLAPTTMFALNLLPNWWLL